MYISYHINHNNNTDDELNDNNNTTGNTINDNNNEQ